MDISDLFARPIAAREASTNRPAPDSANAPAPSAVAASATASAAGPAPAVAPAPVVVRAPAPTQDPVPPRASFAPSAPGFLADLEHEAGGGKVGSELDPATLARNGRLTNAACRAAADYWARMVDHLNLLKPTAPGRYVFDGRTVVAGAPARDFGVVPRLRNVHGSGEEFESVTLTWRVGVGETLRVVKDFPPDIERLRARLSFAGINAFESQVRHKQTARLLGTLFEFTADVVASVHLTPLPEQGKVRLSLRNIDALERIEAELPAFAIRANELDELARWICGKPHTLLKHAQAVARHEP